MKNPKVTVLMPVYNAEKYISEAIQSILNQTFRDFEFLIINDGSTDSSVEIIESFKDERIRLVHNEKNMNLVPTLNRGLELAQGEYVARMDADDISYPTRLEKQVEYMDKNPEIGICGTWIEFFDAGKGIQKYPVEHELIKASILFFNPMAHPTVMMRKAILNENNLRYSRNLSEDYDLWGRASFLVKLHNLPEVLLNYRISKGSYTQTYSSKSGPVHIEMIKERLLNLGIVISDSDASIFRDGGWKIPLEKTADATKFGELLDQILQKNRSHKIYAQKYLRDLCADVWGTACFNLRERRSKRAMIYFMKMNFLAVIRTFSTYKFLYKLATNR